MVSPGLFGIDRRGFSMVELAIVMAVIAAVGAATVPLMTSYSRAATLKAAAEEMAAALNRARQLAISQSQGVCVEVAGNRYRYWFNGCVAGQPWTGPGTDETGFFRLVNNVGVMANVNPVFTYLGAANPGATFTVTNPQGGSTLSVAVSPAGRVRICPSGGCTQ